MGTRGATTTTNFRHSAYGRARLEFEDWPTYAWYMGLPR